MIKDLISVIMPTTGRPQRALECVKLLLETTAGWPVEVVCIVDVDVQSARLLGELLENYDGDNLKRWDVRLFDQYQGQPRAWNAGLKLSKGEYVVFAADDLRWTAGWLEAAMRCMATLPEGGGLVGLNDLHRTFAMRRESTHYLATRRYIVEHQNGCIGFPHYSGLCNDSEACGRARKAGLYVPCYAAVVEHVHYDYGIRPKDGTDKLWEADRRPSLKEFYRREKLGFPNDFEPAIGPETLEVEDYAP